MKISHKNIPLYDYDKKEWSKKSFENQLEFGEFLLNDCFKEPGQYNFHKDRVSHWNAESRKFTANGRYIDYAEDTPEYNNYWDTEEIKSRLGVIWKNKDEYFYTTRDYYFLLNFCPITNKEKGFSETFCDIRDAQYHMMLYEKIAETFHSHSVILKRRQMLNSYCHTAKSVNYLWFEYNKRVKWFASDDNFINDVDGSWSILNQFKMFLNAHTGWFRPFTPDSPGKIQQKQEVKNNGQKAMEGSMSIITATSLKRDPKSGVGGPTYWAWYEEGGIAPTANETLQYMDPALISGLERVGSFCISGSVGDLKECEPLKDFLLKPDSFGFFAVPTRLADKTGTVQNYGLFIPAQYGMPEATDEHGNSLPELALEILDKAENIGFKKGEYGKLKDEDPWTTLKPADYILKKSQNPRTIEEAFAYRNVGYFDVQRIEKRQKDIKLLKERNDFYEKQGLLEIGKDGKIILKKLSDIPEAQRPTPIGYPVKPEMIDKRGCVSIWEFPDSSILSGLYFAGCDPVEVGKTSTSDSVFSLHIYKRGTRKITKKADGSIEETYTKGRIVASYRGRFDNPDDHNEQGLLLLRLYNAIGACERNKPNFINYCRRKGFAHMIARRKDLPFEKDIDMTGTKNDDFGVWAGSDGKLLEIQKRTTYEYLDYEVDTITKKTKEEDGIDISKTIRGYDIVPDYWFLEECKLWNEDANADAFISASLAIIFGQSRELSFEKTVYEEEKPIEQREVIKAAPRSLLDYGRPKRSNNLLNY